MIGTRRTLIQSKHNGGSAKLKIFLLIPLRQLMQPNFMTDTILYKHNRDNTHFGVSTFKLRTEPTTQATKLCS